MQSAFFEGFRSALVSPRRASHHRLRARDGARSGGIGDAAFKLNVSATCIRFLGSMRPLHPNGFNAAHALLRSMANLGWYAFPGARILDFGCGDGARVYQFRDEGFDAYGFDMSDTVALRAPDDRAFFSALEKPRENWSDTRMPDDAVRVPHDDASFDFVFSETVIEHCYALDGMMRECARLLKPGGISLHTYPSRNAVLEPHFLVPFGGRIQDDRWLKLWATLGVRNWGQREMTAAQAAYHNRFYLDSGICYRSNDEIIATARKHFNHARFVDREYYADDGRAERLRRYWRAIRSEKPLEEIAAIPRLCILMARHA